MMKSFFSLWLSLLCVGVCTNAYAESTDELKVDWATDGGLTGSTGVLWITFELMKDYIAPDKCVWCQTNEMDETITDSLSWPTPSHAAKPADAVAFGVVPALAFGALALSGGLENRIQNFGADALNRGEKRNIKLIYSGKKYSAYLQREVHELGRIRIFWTHSLADEFDEFNVPNKWQV